MEETARAKILNVDDNEVVRYAVTRILRQAGYDVTEAATGTEALELAMKLPDIVLLDVNLPDINGFEVCHRLKSDPVTRAIPVLHLSATYLDSKAMVHGLEGGADGYLTQPVEPRVLLAHINALLRSSRLEKQLARSNRSLKVLSDCNQALLRSQSETHFAQEVCRILVEVGKYRFVWICSRERDTDGTLGPIARWGEDAGLSDFALASWDANAPQGCPIGEAIRTRKPFLIADMRTDSRCEPWRNEALERGFVSAYALPLVIDGDLWGAISLWTDMEGILDDEEIKLLSELAYDLSYGIESLRTRERALKSQEALREREERLRRISSLTSDIAYSCIKSNSAGYSIDWIEGAVEGVTGRSPDDIKTLDCLRTLVFDEDLPIFDSRVTGIAPGASGACELRLTHDNGKVVWVASFAECVLDPEFPNSLRLYGALVDITERKLTERALRESEQASRLLIEKAPVGIGTIQDGVLCNVNPKFLEVFGYDSMHEVLGRPVEEFYPPEERALITQRWKDRLSGKPLPMHYEVKGLKKNGESFDLAVWPTVVNYEKKPAVLTFCVDNTEAKSLRHQLLQSQKMEAIGTLAGGIAHDFNNILQVVLGYSELLLAGKEKTDKDFAELDKINSASRHGADLVQNLMMFSRKVEPNLKPLNVNDEVNQIQKLLSRTIPKNIKLTAHLSRDVRLVEADISQMGQVLMNLAVNSRDAMPDGGKLNFETSNMELDEEFCLRHPGSHPGTYVLLTVSDTGTGMTKETVSHIFEPFFTTKGVGHGTGLGLATVYGIVKQHKGHITCYSEPGQGTTFNIYLPAVEQTGEAEPQENIAAIIGGTEMILLVDDEEHLRDLGATILKRYGYEVLTAGNGKEALDIYRSNHEKISLVILDLIMPEMDGKKCLAEILNINPQANVLIASGHSEGILAMDSSLPGAKGLVAKPYEMKKLLQAVRDVLDAVG